jgi:hypothetical protein
MTEVILLQKPLNSMITTKISKTNPRLSIVHPVAPAGWTHSHVQRFDLPPGRLSCATIREDIACNRTFAHSTHLEAVKMKSALAFTQNFCIPQQAASRLFIASRASRRPRATASRAQMSTCRVCKTTFRSSENGPRACSYHLADYLGAENSKFAGVGPRKGVLIEHGTTWFWDCCGATDVTAIGCMRGAHKTYDDV